MSETNSNSTDSKWACYLTDFKVQLSEAIVGKDKGGKDGLLPLYFTYAVDVGGKNVCGSNHFGEIPVGKTSCLIEDVDAKTQPHEIPYFHLALHKKKVDTTFETTTTASNGGLMRQQSFQAPDKKQQELVAEKCDASKIKVTLRMFQNPKEPGQVKEFKSFDVKKRDEFLDVGFHINQLIRQDPTKAVESFEVKDRVTSVASISFKVNVLPRGSKKLIAQFRAKQELFRTYEEQFPIAMSTLCGKKDKLDGHENYLDRLCSALGKLPPVDDTPAGQEAAKLEKSLTVFVETEMKAFADSLCTKRFAITRDRDQQYRSICILSFQFANVLMLNDVSSPTTTKKESKNWESQIDNPLYLRVVGEAKQDGGEREGGGVQELRKTRWETLQAAYNFQTKNGDTISSGLKIIAEGSAYAVNRWGSSTAKGLFGAIANALESDLAKGLASALPLGKALLGGIVTVLQMFQAMDDMHSCCERVLQKMYTMMQVLMDPQLQKFLRENVPCEEKFADIICVMEDIKDYINEYKAKGHMMKFLTSGSSLETMEALTRTLCEQFDELHQFCSLHSIGQQSEMMRELLEATKAKNGSKCDVTLQQHFEKMKLYSEAQQRLLLGRLDDIVVKIEHQSQTLQQQQGDFAFRTGKIDEKFYNSLVTQIKTNTERTIEQAIQDQNEVIKTRMDRLYQDITNNIITSKSEIIDELKRTEKAINKTMVNKLVGKLETGMEALSNQIMVEQNKVFERLEILDDHIETLCSRTKQGVDLALNILAVTNRNHNQQVKILYQMSQKLDSVENRIRLFDETLAKSFEDHKKKVVPYLEELNRGMASVESKMAANQLLVSSHFAIINDKLDMLMNADGAHSMIKHAELDQTANACLSRTFYNQILPSVDPDMFNDEDSWQPPPESPLLGKKFDIVEFGKSLKDDQSNFSIDQRKNCLCHDDSIYALRLGPTIMICWRELEQQPKNLVRCVMELEIDPDTLSKLQKDIRPSDWLVHNLLLSGPKIGSPTSTLGSPSKIEPFEDFLKKEERYEVLTPQELQPKLGETGAFTFFHKIPGKENGVAVKECRMLKGVQRSESEFREVFTTIEQEYDILKKISPQPPFRLHRYIGKCKNISQSLFQVSSVFLPNKSVYDRVYGSESRFKGAQSESFVKVALKHCLEGLKQLHTNNPVPIIHGKLTLGNILILDPGTQSSDTLSFLLSDFGMPTLQKEMVSPSRPYWNVPPEKQAPIPAKRVTVPAGDIWSLGCCVCEMLSGRKVWKGTKDRDGETIKGAADLLGHMREMRKMYDKDPDKCEAHDLRPSIAAPPSGGISPELVQLVARMLTWDHTKRPSAADLLADPYFRTL